MQRFLAAAMVIAICGGTIVRAADTRPGAELAGKWSLISTNGEKDKHADDENESTILEYDLDAGTWKLEPRSTDGGFTFYGTFAIDNSQTPKVMDAVITGDGGNTDVFIIYQIEGDKLTLNMRQDGQRAADFELRPDESTLFVFKRMKTD